MSDAYDGSDAESSYSASFSARGASPSSEDHVEAGLGGLGSSRPSSLLGVANGKGKQPQARSELDAIRSTYSLENGAGSAVADESARKGAIRAKADKARAEQERADALESIEKKYKGVKASRAELFDDGLGGEDDGSDELDDGNEDDDQEEDHEDSQDQEDESEDEEEEEEESQEDDEEDDDESSAASVRAGAGALTLGSQAAAEASLHASMAERQAREAEKGRAVFQQREAYELALDVRIRAQKLVSALGGVDRQVFAASNDSEDTEAEAAQRATLDMANRLLDFSSTLFSIRASLLEDVHEDALDEEQRSMVQAAAELAAEQETEAGNEDSEAEQGLASASPSRKRKRVQHATMQEARNARDAHVAQLLSLEEQALWPVSESVLSKWSAHSSVGGAAAGAGASSFKNSAAGGSALKAVNQSAVVQIDNAMRGDALERLRQRTMTWRGTKRVKLAEEEEKADGAAEGASQPTDADKDVFDDTDFYHALLRELIDAKGASSSAFTGTSSAGSLAQGDLASAAEALAQSAKKLKKPVDTKASKGRKLRYEVHEKIANFMPKVRTRVTWSNEQMDRLFAQLGGKTVEEEGSSDEEEGEEAQTDGLQDGIRLFD